ncbi:MAG: FAD:protein FMN transferase [Lautropia sp.]|nr:FAD:protein FMN transferase [Lautropia sp.]
MSSASSPLRPATGHTPWQKDTAAPPSPSPATITRHASVRRHMPAMFARRMTPLLALPLAALLAGCQPKVEKISGPTMGSTWQVSFVREGSAPDAAAIQTEVQKILGDIDKAVSTYRDDSDVAHFNAAPAGICLSMPAVAIDLARYAHTLAASSQGAFDITLLPALDAWGFGPKAARQKATSSAPDAAAGSGQASAPETPGKQGVTIDSLQQAPATPPEPDADTLNALRAQVGQQHLRIDNNRLCKNAPISIEFNSIAAGAAIDRIASMLAGHGIQRYLIEVTGEIRGNGKKPDGSPWRVAIEAPIDNVRQAQKIIALDGQSISTSGDYRHYREVNGRRLSHTLDPRTLSPVTHRLAAVTVAHPEAMQADGLSTMLMVLGPDAGHEYAVRNNLAALFVVRDNDRFITRATTAFDKLYPPAQSPNQP